MKRSSMGSIRAQEGFVSFKTGSTAAAHVHPHAARRRSAAHRNRTRPPAGGGGQEAARRRSLPITHAWNWPADGLIPPLVISPLTLHRNVISPLVNSHERFVDRRSEETGSGSESGRASHLITLALPQRKKRQRRRRRRKKRLFFFFFLRKRDQCHFVG